MLLSFASMVKTVRLACVAAVLVIAAPAVGRVGVTSQTDGDPVGKPPTQNERVLRVGIDIQANELITTKADDRAHLVFLDGTALTVSPNARLVIDKFVYDPQTQTGDLALTASAGVFRLVGGKISKVSPIVIKTPSATMGVRGGIGMFTVTPGQTTADFLYGKSMTVQASGQTQIATRPRTMIVTSLRPPPRAQPPTPTQIATPRASQINTPPEAAAPAPQQGDIQTTHPATPVSATVPVAPA